MGLCERSLQLLMHENFVTKLKAAHERTCFLYRLLDAAVFAIKLLISSLAGTKLAYSIT